MNSSQTTPPPDYVEPEYRVERVAQIAEHDQMLVNFLRKLLRLPIKVTGKEAGNAVRRSYLRTTK